MAFGVALCFLLRCYHRVLGVAAVGRLESWSGCGCVVVLICEYVVRFVRYVVMVFASYVVTVFARFSVS